MEMSEANILTEVVTGNLCDGESCSASSVPLVAFSLEHTLIVEPFH